jgi:hypothetical protein
LNDLLDPMIRKAQGSPSRRMLHCESTAVISRSLRHLLAGRNLPRRGLWTRESHPFDALPEREDFCFVAVASA